MPPSQLAAPFDTANSTAAPRRDGEGAHRGLPQRTCRRVGPAGLAWTVMTFPTHRATATDATQHRILDAATEVFAVRGFSVATIADIVASSGASLASIYRHFGGMRELFLAVFDRVATDIGGHIDESAATGADDRSAFEAAARAYLDALWRHRQVAGVFASVDVPPGFAVVRESRLRHALQRWAPASALDPSPRGQLVIRMLGAIMAEASSLVILCDDRSDVALITDATVEAIDRVTR